MYNYNPYQYYQPPQPQPQNLLPSQQIMQTNGRPTFEAFKMSPNSSILLADTTAPIVWKCTTDGLGNVTSEAFDITPHKETPVINTTAILSEMNDRITRLEEMANAKSTTKRKSDHKKYIEKAARIKQMLTL